MGAWFFVLGLMLDLGLSLRSGLKLGLGLGFVEYHSQLLPALSPKRIPLGNGVNGDHGEDHGDGSGGPG